MIDDININQEICSQFRNRSLKQPSSAKIDSLISLVQRYVELEFLRHLLTPLDEHFTNGVLLQFIGQSVKRYVA